MRALIESYITAESSIYYYQLKADFSVTKVYEGYVGADFSMVEPMAYRNSVYVVLYSFSTGNVKKFQLLTPANTPLYPQATWSDVWAKEWTRFAFFQMGGENFFIKTNLAHKKVNIDHFMDDAAEGSHPVLNTPAPTEILNAANVVSFEDSDGQPFFAVYSADGSLSINRVHPNCLGWSQVLNDTVATNAKGVSSFTIKGQNCLFISAV